MKDYTLIHNREEALSDEEKLQAAAIAARTLRYVIGGLEATGHVWDDDDVGLIREHAAYLEHLTWEFLPSRFEPSRVLPSRTDAKPLDPAPTDQGVIHLKVPRGPGR